MIFLYCSTTYVSTYIRITLSKEAPEEFFGHLSGFLGTRPQLCPAKVQTRETKLRRRGLEGRLYKMNLEPRKALQRVISCRSNITCVSFLFGRCYLSKNGFEAHFRIDTFCLLPTPIPPYSLCPFPIPIPLPTRFPIPIPYPYPYSLSISISLCCHTIHKNISLCAPKYPPTTILIPTLYQTPHP